MTAEVPIAENNEATKLLREIRQTRNGTELWQMLHELGAVFGRTWQANYSPKSPLVIGIPRGGVPLSQGFHSVFPDSPLIMANTGLYRQPESPAIDLSQINGAADICLVDTVVFRGRTMTQILSELASHVGPERLHVITAFASPKAVRLLQDPTTPENFLQVGEVEAREKQVWDPYFYQQYTTMADIPNFGQLLAYCRD